MKRFTETQKWDDKWMRQLSPEAKLFWLWMLDKCDAAGVIEPDYDLASFQIGCDITEKTVSELGDRIQNIGGGKVWIHKFIAFQYGEISEDCRGHNPVFASIAKHFPKGYPKGIQRVSNDIRTSKDNTGQEEGDARGNKTPVIPDVLQAVEGFATEWENFKAHRRQKRVGMTKRAEELMISKLSQHPLKAMLALQMAIERGWTGFEWSWFNQEQQRNGKTQGGPQRSL